MARFRFLAISKNFDIEVSGNDEQEEKTIKYWILSPFASRGDAENDTATIPYYMQNTIELQNKVKDLVSKLTNINPKINKLSDYFSKELGKNEWFYLSIDEDLSQENIYDILVNLANIGADKKTMELNQSSGEILKKILSKYDILCYDEHTKQSIGEIEKKKRICRYCQRSMPDVSFKNVAHTISEALGNKSIKTNDECDECNKNFGDTIEQDFLCIFDFPRLFFNIKKKGGYPQKFVGNNYVFENEQNIIKIKHTISDPQKTQETIDDKKIMLSPKRQFPPQNIYKCLCKYVYGVLDDKTIKSFDRTRRWLIGETTENQLPKLARYYHLEPLEHPRVTLFIRKDDTEKELPHIVAELRIINMSFVVILPFSDKDSYIYDKEEDYNRFWDFFDIYSKIPEWEIVDCSGLDVTNPTIALHIVQKEINKNKQ